MNLDFASRMATVPKSWDGELPKTLTFGEDPPATVKVLMIICLT